MPTSACDPMSRKARSQAACPKVRLCNRFQLAFNVFWRYALAFYCINPLAIYKAHRRGQPAANWSRNQIFLARSLRLKDSRLDAFVHRCYLFWPLPLLYLNLKWTLSQLAAFLNLAALEEALGKPMGSVKGVMFLLYTVTVLSESCHALNAFWQRSQPLDSPLERFLLQPQQELRRLDLVLRLKLLAMLDGLDALDGPEQDLNGSLPVASAHRKYWLDWKRQRALIAGQLGRVWRMRPSFYSQVSLNRMYVFAGFGFPVGLLTIWLMVGELLREVVRVAVRLRCAARLSPAGPSCGLLDEQASFADRWALYELTLCMIIMMLIQNLHLNCLMMFVVHVREVTAGVRKRLRSCLALQTSLEEFEAGLRRPRLPAARYRRLELELLGTLIQTSISCDEITSYAKVISRLLTSGCCAIIACLLISIWLSVRNSEPDLVRLANIFTLVSCMGANMAVALCAHTYARMVKLERYAWSILAKLSQRNRRTGWSAADIIDSSWRKLVLGQEICDQRKCVRPLGLELTYGRMLQLNFGLLSFAILLKIV